MKYLKCHLSMDEKYETLSIYATESPCEKREVPEGDWLNFTVKVTVTAYDQVIIEMFVVVWSSNCLGLRQSKAKTYNILEQLNWYLTQD